MSSEVGGVNVFAADGVDDVEYGLVSGLLVEFFGWLAVCHGLGFCCDGGMVGRNSETGYRVWVCSPLLDRGKGEGRGMPCVFF